MEWFTVQYRSSQGDRLEAEFQVEDRAALFKVLSQKQISVICVRSGRINKKLKSQSSTSCARHHKRTLTGFAVALVLLAAGCFYYFYAVHEDGGYHKTTKPSVSERKKIPDAAPIAVNHVSNTLEHVESVAASKYPKNPWGTPIPKELEHKPHWKYTTEDYEKIDPGYKARHERFLSEQAKIPWHHSCECDIARLIFTRPGDPILDMPLSKNFKQQFLKSLETAIIVSKDDDPEIAQQKLEMIEVKKYLKDCLDNGEDIVAILEQEKKRLSDLNGMRDNLLRELRELEKTATSEEEIDDYVAAANKMLSEKGGGVLKLPISAARLRLRRSAREKANK